MMKRIDSKPLRRAAYGVAACILLYLMRPDPIGGAEGLRRLAATNETASFAHWRSVRMHSVHDDALGPREVLASTDPLLDALSEGGGAGLRSFVPSPERIVRPQNMTRRPPERTAGRSFLLDRDAEGEDRAVQPGEQGWLAGRVLGTGEEAGAFDRAFSADAAGVSTAFGTRDTGGGLFASPRASPFGERIGLFDDEEADRDEGLFGQPAAQERDAPFRSRTDFFFPEGDRR